VTYGLGIAWGVAGWKKKKEKKKRCPFALAEDGITSRKPIYK
jgi:hypothetical protein